MVLPSWGMAHQVMRPRPQVIFPPDSPPEYLTADLEAYAQSAGHRLHVFVAAAAKPDKDHLVL